MSPKVKSYIDQILSSNSSIGADTVDPWHVVSAVEDVDHMIVIEFSEHEGPRPALCVPPYSLGSEENGGSNSTASEPPHSFHFDRSDFAVWLMTTDYQSSNQRSAEGNFASENDVQVILSNEEQGLHVLAQHFTLFDLDARGFLRPFCLAYATNDAEKLYKHFQTMRRHFNQMLQPIKLCNKAKFLQELTRSINHLENAQNRTVTSYYELCYASNVESASNSESEQNLRPKNKIASCSDVPTADDDADQLLNATCRKIQTELEDVKNFIQASLRKFDANAQCFASHAEPDISRWLSKCRLVKSTATNNGNADVPGVVVDKDLEALCPCVFSQFKRCLHSVWANFCPMTRYSTYFCGDTTSVSLGSLSILKLPAKLNTVKSNEENLEDIMTELQQLNTTKLIPASSDVTLLSLGPHLKHVLFPLFFGQFFLVCGSEFRKHLVEKFVDSLSRFMPSSSGTATAHHSAWNTGCLRASNLVDYKLYGVQSDWNCCSEDLLPPGLNLKYFLSVLDLNDKTLEAPAYEGGLLDILSKSSFLKKHKSDCTLVPYIVQLVFKFALAAYVLYHHIYDESSTQYKLLSANGSHNGEPAEQPSNSTESVVRMHIFGDKFKLTKSDMKIIKYLVELLKVANSDDRKHGFCTPTTPCDQDAQALNCMVLDQSAKLIKLNLST